MNNNLRIAILGTRGIPACYGGFETFAEELSKRLVERGHSVTVYGRRSFFKSSDAPKEYNGVTIKILPTIMQKYLETPLHSFITFLHSSLKLHDVLLLCNAANSPFAWIARLKGLPIAINVDGIERKRAKWNALGRAWYHLGEKCSVWFANNVIADAKVIAEYYNQRFKISPTVIAYGAKATFRESGVVLGKFGLSSRNYILYVSRLEPENNALGVIQAYNQSGVDMPLVIVGDAPYAKEYVANLKRTAKKGVIFTGYQFGEAYQELQSNCYFYIQATEVGGTHPALIESMAYGNCVIANGTPENIEVLDQTGIIYQKNDFVELSEIIRDLIANPEKVAQYGQLARDRATKHYNWDLVCDQYEALFYKLVEI